MNAERPWILVRMLPTGPYKNRAVGAAKQYVSENGSKLSVEDILRGKHLVPETIGYIAKNYGRTPGWVTSIWCNAKMVPAVNDLPPDPDYSSKSASIHIEKCDDLYAPRTGRRGNIFIPAAALVSVAKRTAFLYVYGIIHYRDWEGEHETRFCFYWHVPGERELTPQGFYQEGPEGYNGQT